MPEPEPTIALNGGRPTLSLNSMTALSASWIVTYFFGSFWSTSMSIQIDFTLSALLARRTALSFPVLGSFFIVLCSEVQNHMSLKFVVPLTHSARLTNLPRSWNGHPIPLSKGFAGVGFGLTIE